MNLIRSVIQRYKRRAAQRRIKGAVESLNEKLEQIEEANHNNEEYRRNPRCKQ